MDTTKEPAKQSLRYLSLCSGYEGIGLGLKRLLPNLRTVAYVEIEAYACSRLVSAMEEELLDPAPIWTNIKTFPFREFRGCVDILTGGFPCQPFSQAGQRKSTEDPRHLFPYILEGIRECRPAIVFLENVEGILTSSTGTGENVLKYVLGSLESVGYRATAGIFSASECLDGSGKRAPHQRKRVFILANDDRGRFKEQRRSIAIPKEDKGQATISESERFCADGWPAKSGDQPGEDCLDGSGSLWPSRPGEDQFAWEEPRVVGDSKSVSGDDPNSRVFTKEHSREGIQGSAGGVSGDEPRIMGDSTSKGLQEREESEQQQPLSSTEHSNGEPEDGEAQSELGGIPDGPPGGGVDSVTGSVDAVANRVDRLRLLGNGVFPATSERAFLVLWNRLMTQE